MFINVFEVPETNGIMYIPGRPREYRADCKAGMFKIGESKITGNELNIEILSCDTFEAELFNYPRQQWLQIIFVDTDNIVSHVLFKNESLDNFIEMFRDLSKDKKALGTGIIKATMNKRGRRCAPRAAFAGRAIQELTMLSNLVGKKTNQNESKN
ncbi:MAG: hypothetical protein QNJ38_10845 [Prochloraceae cyanobacterium]|nr:hypothetical protein [Prochloraceae cyanobacterium]